MKHEGMSMAEQLAVAAVTTTDGAAVGNTAANTAPAAASAAPEASDFDELFDLPSADAIMPMAVEAVKKEVERNDALFAKIETAVVDYTRKLWPVRVEGENFCISAKGYYALYEMLLGGDGLLNGRIKGKKISSDDSVQQAAMKHARLTYARTAIPIVVELRPGNRDAVLELLNDLEDFQIVYKAKSGTKASGTVYFGDAVYLPGDAGKDYEDVMALLAAAWNTGVCEVERSQFRKDVTDLRKEVGKGLSCAELLKGVLGKKFLFAPAWNGMADGKRVTEPRPATAMVVETFAEEGRGVAVKVLEVVSTNPEYEDLVKAIADGGIFISVRSLQEGRLNFKNQVRRDFRDKVATLFHLVKAGVRNEEREEARRAEVDRLKEGTVDIVAWYRNHAKGAVSVSFHPWMERNEKGGTDNVFFTARFVRTEEGKSSGIRFESFAPKGAGRALPALERLIGKEFMPNDGGSKIEGNVSGGVSVEDAKLFRRMLSAGSAAAYRVENARKKQAKPKTEAAADETAAASSTTDAGQ